MESFIFNKYDSIFNKIHFLSNIMQKKPVPGFAHIKIYKQDDIAVVCNKQRWHAVDFSEQSCTILDGAWSLISKTKKRIILAHEDDLDDEYYKNLCKSAISLVKKWFKKERIKKKNTIEFTLYEKNFDGELSGALALLARAMNKNFCINYNYIKDLYCDSISPYTAWIQNSPQYPNIVIENNSMFAVIAPIYLKNF